MSFWNRLPPPREGLRAVVVLPVRNEAHHLGAALEALTAQVDFSQQPFDQASFEVIVLANNCDDESAAVARGVARAHPGFRLHTVEAAFPPEHANVGYARRQLMDEACRRLEIAGVAERAILSTDGDTRVAGDWLVNTLYELRSGADAVGGRIFTDSTELPSADALRIRRLDAVHSLLRSRLESLIDCDCGDPWPRHHQHFGASLAVTAHAYRLVGGVPNVPYLEDEALVRALRRSDRKVRHSPSVRVTTSSRLDGRAAVGLSWQLRQWAEDPSQHAARKVESAQRFARAISARLALRSLWACSRGAAANGAELSPAGVAHQLGLPPRHVSDALAEARHFGEAWETLEPQYHETANDGDWVPLPQALEDLRLLVKERLAGQREGAVKRSSRYCA